MPDNKRIDPAFERKIFEIYHEENPKNASEKLNETAYRHGFALIAEVEALLARVRELEEALTGIRQALTDPTLERDTYAGKYFEMTGWIILEVLPAIDKALPSPPTEKTT